MLKEFGAHGGGKNFAEFQQAWPLGFTRGPKPFSKKFEQRGVTLLARVQGI